MRLSVEFTHVVDLIDLSPLGALGIDGRDLLGATMQQARLIGHAVSWLGFSGLLVRSARHAGTNLVIYTGQLGPTDRVELA